jgi:putative DNA primase/helicase
MSDHPEIEATRLWNEAVPIAGTVTEFYLHSVRHLILPVAEFHLHRIRHLVLPPDISPRVLRFHPDCPFGADVRHPCLLALYRSIIGDEPRAIMRTALTPDGLKIGRMALGPVNAMAIKLWNDVDETMALTVGECLETTLAGMEIGLAPAWVLGGPSAIATFPVLTRVKELTILGETGDGGANERAANECAVRWNADGRAVRRVAPLFDGDLDDALTRLFQGKRA